MERLRSIRETKADGLIVEFLFLPCAQAIFDMTGTSLAPVGHTPAPPVLDGPAGDPQKGTGSPFRYFFLPCYPYEF
jgi:hypothetical protein